MDQTSNPRQGRREHWDIEDSLAFDNAIASVDQWYTSYQRVLAENRRLQSILNSYRELVSGLYASRSILPPSLREKVEALITPHAVTAFE